MRREHALLGIIYSHRQRRKKTGRSWGRRIRRIKSWLLDLVILAHGLEQFEHDAHAALHVRIASRL